MSLKRLFSLSPVILSSSNDNGIQKWLESIITASPRAALSVGIGLTILGSCLMAVGNVIMKIAIHKESRRLQRDIQVPITSYLWWMGLLTYSFGAVLHLIGLGFAPASVLAPLNSLGLVANAIGAVTFLHEHLSLIDGFWTLSTMVGVALCAVSTLWSHDESFVVDGIESWTDPLYLIYIVFCCLSLVVFLVLINQGEAKVADEQYELAYRQHLAEGHIELSEIAKALAQGAKSDESHLESQSNVLRDLLQEHQKAYNEIGWNDEIYPARIGLFYSIVAGIVGAQCVLQIKEFAAFLKISVDHQSNIWLGVQPCLASLFGITSIILQMHFLNLGLARGDATVVIPAYYVSWTTFGTLGGFAKFHEIFGLSATSICLFVLGLLITLISIVLMAMGEVKRVKDDVEAKLPPTGISEEVSEKPLKFGVPLGMGLGIITYGRLAGRLRPLPADIQTIRRTRSFHDFTPGWMEKQSRKPPHGEPTIFTWTVDGGKLPISKTRETPAHSRVPYHAIPTSETSQARYTGQRVWRTPPTKSSKKYKTLDQICFEPDIEHASPIPDDMLSNFLNSEQYDIADDEEEGNIATINVPAEWLECAQISQDQLRRPMQIKNKNNVYLHTYHLDKKRQVDESYINLPLFPEGDQSYIAYYGKTHEDNVGQNSIHRIFMNYFR